MSGLPTARRLNFMRRGQTAFARHRHGTWLLLFASLFTLLWLLAGWAGMANGTWRGVLVGAATALAVRLLFPLRPRALAPAPVPAGFR
ncbi:MAG TPA: hypothetical protein VKQ29_06265 [Aliidongia sp.]|nr:hypothetical protein [Aliidongia sp.]